jgi:hypothetical protein
MSMTTPSKRNLDPQFFTRRGFLHTASAAMVGFRGFEAMARTAAQNAPSKAIPGEIDVVIYLYDR